MIQLTPHHYLCPYSSESNSLINDTLNSFHHFGLHKYSIVFHHHSPLNSSQSHPLLRYVVQSLI
jgi:capsule polysaccharide modification protein KpsS